MIFRFEDVAAYGRGPFNRLRYVTVDLLEDIMATFQGDSFGTIKMGVALVEQWAGVRLARATSLASGDDRELVRDDIRRIERAITALGVPVELAFEWHQRKSADGINTPPDALAGWRGGPVTFHTAAALDLLCLSLAQLRELEAGFPGRGKNQNKTHLGTALRKLASVFEQLDQGPRRAHIKGGLTRSQRRDELLSKWATAGGDEISAGHIRTSYLVGLSGDRAPTVSLDGFRSWLLWRSDEKEGSVVE